MRGQAGDGGFAPFGVAGERARRQRQEQRSQFDRADYRGVSSHFPPAEIVNLDDHQSMLFDTLGDRVPPYIDRPS
jgi:hypothetical protein